MKNLFLIILFFFVSKIAFGQNYLNFSLKEASSKCQLNVVEVDKNDNIIITGYFESDNNVSKPMFINKKELKLIDSRGRFIVKLNQKKEILWFKEIKSQTGLASHIVIDDSSNVYLIGKFQNKIAFDDKNSLGSLSGDIFIAKYASDGTLKWVKKIGGSSDAGIHRPKIDNNGNLYIIGMYQNSLEVEEKQVLIAKGINQIPYLLKLDRNGNYIWANDFDEKLELNSVSINKENEVFLAGNFKESIILSENIKLNSEGNKDIFYAKYDQNGQIIWAKSIGGALWDDCGNLEADNLGNIYLAGVISDEAKFDTLKINYKTDLGVNIFLTKISAINGQITWVKNMAYGGDLYDKYNYKETVKSLKLNEVGEPYLIGTVLTYLNINQEKSLKGNFFGNFTYFLKFDNNGTNVFSTKEDLSVGYGISLINSMTIDSKRDIFFTGNSTILGGGGYHIDVAFLSNKAELYKETCNTIQTIKILSDSNKLLSLSNELVSSDFNYQWYFNGKPILNATQATFQAKDAGYYSMKITNNSCQITSNNIAFYANNNAVPAELLYDFDNKYLYSNPPYKKIEWYRNNILIENETNFNYYYSQDGTYVIRKYIDDSGFYQESNEITIKDGAIAAIGRKTLNDDGDACKPIPSLKALFGNTNIDSITTFKFQWYFNGNLIKDSTKIHLKVVVPGDYQVSIFDEKLNKNYLSGKYKIVIEDFPKSLSISKIDDNCGASALLKVDDSFMQRYTFQSIVWRLDGNEIPNENSPFLNVNKGGFYTFSLKYFDNSNDVTCNYNSFVTFDKKPDFKPNVAYSYAGSGCVVDSFKVSIDYDKNFKYQWTRDGVLLSNKNTNEIFVKDKNTYQATISRADGCTNITKEVSLKGCTGDSSNTFLALNPPPIFTDKISLYNNEYATLSSGGCSDANLQWIKDNQEIIGATQKNLQVEKSGVYSLKIEKFGCIANSNVIEIGVEPILALGENELQFWVDVYPNPTEEKLYVSIPPELNEPILIKLTDILGKLIKKHEVLDSKNQVVDLKELPDGIYFLTFETNNKRVVKKIIKKS